MQEDMKQLEEDLVKRLGVGNWLLRSVATLLTIAISWGTYELVDNRAKMAEVLSSVSDNQQTIIEVKRDIAGLMAAQQINFDDNDWFREERTLKEEWASDIKDIKSAMLRLEQKVDK